MRHKPYYFIITFLACLLFSACAKDDTDTPPVDQAFKGEFVSGAHSTSGIASIDSSETILTLTNFKSSSGPDLNLYLATSISNVTGDFIDLGDLKGLQGTYTYNLPGNTDYLTYKYVVVWCVDFDVNFGYAELEKQ